MHARISLGAIALAAGLAIAAPLAIAPVYAEMTVMVGGAPMYPTKNIVENAVNSKDHTTLVAAVKAAGLVDTLESAGPFTVFAPTNEAFAALPKGTVETLLKPENKDKLTAILTYHVVPGRMTAADIAGKIDEMGGKLTLKTVQGEELTFARMGKSASDGHRRQGRRRAHHHRRRAAVERRHPRHQQGADPGLSDRSLRLMERERRAGALQRRARFASTRASASGCASRAPCLGSPQ